MMIVNHNLRVTEIVSKVHCVHDTCTKTHVCVDAIRAMVCLLPTTQRGNKHSSMLLLGSQLRAYPALGGLDNGLRSCCRSLGDAQGRREDSKVSEQD